MPNTERVAWILALCIACAAAAGFYEAFERGRSPCPRQAAAAPIAPDVEAILEHYGIH